MTETIDADSYLEPATQTTLESEVDSLRSQFDEIEDEGLLAPLTDVDSGRYEQLLDRVVSLRETIESHNPTLANERCDTRAETAQKSAEQARDDLAPYRDEGGPLSSAVEGYAESLDETVQTVTSFLNHPLAEYLDGDQCEQLESLREQLADQRTFFIEKQRFESDLDQVSGALVDLRASVEKTLDMETYLTVSEQKRLETRADEVRTQVTTISEADYLSLLAAADHDRLADCKAELSTLERRIQNYNDKFIDRQRERLAEELASLPVKPPNGKTRARSHQK